MDDVALKTSIFKDIYSTLYNYYNHAVKLIVLDENGISNDPIVDPSFNYETIDVRMKYQHRTNDDMNQIINSSNHFLNTLDKVDLQDILNLIFVKDALDLLVTLNVDTETPFIKCYSPFFFRILSTTHPYQR
jgi:hypothetical protein